MLGAIVYKLRAENSARLPYINGRLMHAVFFKILRESSPKLENYVHERLNIKPFTVSFLNPAADLESDERAWRVSKGDAFFWKVTALNEDILQAVLSIAVGYTIQVDKLVLKVERVMADRSDRKDTGVIAKDDFIRQCRKYFSSTQVDFEFLSPVSFRIDNYDAPYPRSELLFASLADKWNQLQMPASADKSLVREVAAQIRLIQWQGQSQSFYFGHDRGTLGFWGIFRYDLRALSEEYRRMFLLLAKFAEFSGVGRLTAQGFGQTRVRFQ